MLSLQNTSDTPCSSEISARKKGNDEKPFDEQSRHEADLPTSTHNQLELLHFSIRDYVCRARKKDIRQNWPFAHPYLQVCLDHGVKDVLPPFEPPDSFRPWYSNREVAPACAHGTKATESLYEGSRDGGLLFPTCIDQVADSSGQEEWGSPKKEKPSSLVSHLEAHLEGVDTESTITSDNLVGEKLLPPQKCRYQSSGRKGSEEPPAVVRVGRPSPVCTKGQARENLLEEEDCGPKAAPRSEDQSSVTGGKEECSEIKAESSRSEGFGSNLSTLVDAMASKVCPVCREFSSTSNTTLNAHIDQCLALVSTNQIADGIKQKINKVKRRKIRTMVDIYATARRCTLEELDRFNGTTWALNAGLVPVAGEDCRENKRPRPSFVNCADGSDSGAVYIDASGTKVRILSQLSDDSTGKPSTSDNVEISLLTCSKRSPISSTSKNSRFRHQSKKLSMLTAHGNQIHRPAIETNHTYDGKRKRKRASLHEEVQGKIRLPGPLKQWVSSKRTGVSRKTIVKDGQHDLAEDNVVQDGDFTAGDNNNSNSPGLMENFVPSPSEPVETLQDAVSEAMNVRSTFEKKSCKKFCLTRGKKFLSMGKKFFAKRSDLPKRIYRFKTIRKAAPGDQKETSFAETGEQIEEVCDTENRCSRTCDPNFPSSFQTAKKNGPLGCPRDSFETEASKFLDDGDLSKISGLDSVGKSDNTDMAVELVAPKPQADQKFLADEPGTVHFDSGYKADTQQPRTGEISSSMENIFSPLNVVSAGVTNSFASGDPRNISAKPLLLDGGSQCLESSLQVQLESTISGLTGEESSFNIHVSNKEVHTKGQAKDDDIDVERNHYIHEVSAFAFQDNTSEVHGEASIPPSRGITHTDALLERPTIGCSCPSLVTSFHEHNRLDKYPAQMSPASSRTSIYAPTVMKPSRKVLSPGSFSVHSEQPDNVNLRPPYQHSESTRKSAGHFVQVYQPAPPKSIMGGQPLSSALPSDAPKGFVDAHSCHCTKGSRCRDSFSVCSSQEILSPSSISCAMRPHGYMSSRNELVDGGIFSGISNFTPKLSSTWQPAISGKVASASVRPEGFVPTNLQADVEMSHGSCILPPGESDHYHAQPSANSVLRLMGKNLMVANNDVERTQLPEASYGSTISHPNTKYLTLLGYPGAYNPKLDQLSSNYICPEASLACEQEKHKEMQYIGSRFSKPHGDFSNFGIGQLPHQSTACCNIHNGGLSRFCFHSGLDSKVQNENLFQNFGPSGSFDVERLGIARKKQQNEALSPFGAKSGQEIIIIDDSPEPYRTNSVGSRAVHCEFRCSQSSQDAALFPVLPNSSFNVVNAASSFPFRHDLAHGDSSIGARHSFFTTCPGASINSVIKHGNAENSGMFGKNPFILPSVAAAQLKPALCHSQRS